MVKTTVMRFQFFLIVLWPFVTTASYHGSTDKLNFRKTQQWTEESLASVLSSNYRKGSVLFRGKRLTDSNVKRDVCDKYDVDGCSIPFGLPFFFKPLFTYSCNRHDICYHCGIDYSISRYLCDTSFRQNMRAACKNRYRKSERWGSSDIHKKAVLKIFSEKEEEFKKIVLRELTQYVGIHKRISIKEFYKVVKEQLEKRLTISALWLARNLCQEPGVQLGKKRLSSSLLNTMLFRSSVNSTSLQLRYNSLPVAGTETVRLSFPENNLRNNDFHNDNMITCSKLLKVISQHAPLLTRSNDRVDCGDIELLVCYFFTEVYYYAVRIFGESSYLKTPSFYCGESFVPQCLPPYDSDFTVNSI